MALKLEITGLEEWNGTFTLAVASVARDLLSDGPLRGVMVDSENDGAVRGTLTAVEDGHLVVDGRRIEISENITGFFVD